MDRVTYIASIEKAVTVLKAFSVEQPELGVVELSRSLGWPKSTVSRILATLAKGGLAEKNPATGKYRLGAALIGLGAQVLVHSDLREVARPLLRVLAQGTQETVSLAVLDGDEVINIEQMLPDRRQLKNVGWVGRRSPLTCSSTGKVLLAYQSEADVERILAKGLVSRTERTISDRALMREELARIRRQGYSTALEEYEEGLSAVAAPVRDHTGKVIAAVTISGPSARFSPERTPELVEESMEGARELSRRLGYGAAGWGVPYAPAPRSPATTHSGTAGNHAP